MTHLSLPLRCLTLLPPWSQAIRYAEKRLENRSGSVAKPLAEWRYGMGLENVPVIGLSQSKATDNDEIRLVAHDLIERGLWDKNNGVTYRSVGEKAATLWLCAELLDVLPPDKCEGDPWHVPGQWGLILGRVWEVKPVPCTGGQGAWNADSWCVKCGHVYANSAKVPGRCYSCKAIFPECRMTENGMAHLNENCGGNVKRPQLEIITEVS
jgi:hypothetical protein